MMLLAISTRIGKSVFFYFNPDLAYIYLQLGISALCFAGPSLYLYIRSVYIKPKKISPHFWWHYITIFLVLLIVGIMYPFGERPDLWRGYFIRNIYRLWLVYIVLSAPMVYKMLRSQAGLKIKSEAFWVLSIFLGNFINCMSYLTAHYTSYITGALSFSFIFYLIILLFLFKNKHHSAFKADPEKYENKKIPKTEAESILDALDQLLQTETLYVNPTLKISDLAERLDVSSHKLSQILNDNLGKNFSSYINGFRIEKAKILLLEMEQFSIDAIGQECGFKAKSSFYNAFKKLTGLTPAQFKSQHKK